MEKLLIIGAGPGGYVAAIRAAQLGMNPVVIEKNELGGTCLNIGCIPTKALIAAAESYENAHDAGKFGVHADVKFNWNEVVAHAKNTVARNVKGIEYLFKKNNIRCIKGSAEFTDANTVKVNDLLISAEHIILATGSAVKELPHIKVDGKNIISSNEALFLEKLPASIAIIGAGAIGVEFAYIFSVFGVEVHLIEAMDRLVPLEDEEVSKELLKEFRKMKIKCYPGTCVEQIEVSGEKRKLSLSGGKTVEVETILSAVGRRPYLDSLGIDKAGVALTQRGFVKTDEHYRTTVPGIYAIGDLIETPMLAHTAEHEGVALVEQIAGLHPHAIDYNLNPGCTYCEPAIASVGLTEQKAKEKGINYKAGKFPFSANGKAVASGHTTGFVKVIIDAGSHKILGAHIIGHGATDLISEFLPAMTLGAKAEDIINSIHPHPTLCEASLEAVLGALGRAIHI